MMKHMMRRGTILLLACALLLALAFTLPGAAADGSETVSGSTYAATTFYVYANSSTSYIRLFAEKGTVYVADYNSNGNLNGYKTEDNYGFYKVQVTGVNNYSKSFVWVPQFSKSIIGVETSRSLIIIFPAVGDYKVVVTPMDKSEINGTYWVQNRFQYWTSAATWSVASQLNCSCRDSGSIGVQPQGGKVTVYCYDTTGNYLRTYTETLTSSRTIAPQAISGYNAVTSGQYVNCLNGACSPSSVTFYYQRTATSGSVTISCYDTAGNYLRTYTETVNSSRTLTPQAISGYTALTTGQYIVFSNGTCNPSSVTFYYQKKATSGTVTVYCYDTAGNYLRAYTETITSSRTLTPQTISGYNPVTSGQYVAYSNGTCTPASVTFYYQKKATSGTVTVYCYDTAGNYLRAYTETITSGRTIAPQAISGYTATTTGQYIDFSNGACSPSSVTFYYQKEVIPVNVTIYCYDTDGNYIRTYTETISTSQTLYPRAISGYTVASSGQPVSVSNGTCSPSTVTFKYRKDIPTGNVTVICRDSRGGVISTTTEKVSGSRTIFPPAITGYTTTSPAQTVTCQAGGVCSPAQIEFIYSLNTAPTGGSTNPDVVTPTLWDTQFKPGTATAKSGDVISNDDRIKNLPYLYDDNPDTSFFWLVWQSEWKDDIPELTAYFNGDTVSSIGIRNGKATGFSGFAKYARATSLRIVVYDNSGRSYSTSIQLNDYYQRDYRVFSLGGTYQDVNRVEIFLLNYKPGDTEKNYIHISDIQFYK